jgi:hypothetical protein
MNQRFLSSVLGGFAIMCLAFAPEARALDELIERALVTQVTHYTCSDGGEWLRCYRQDPKDCRSIANNFVAPCVAAIARPAKSPMSEEDGTALATKLSTCFNQRFLGSYGSYKLPSPECAKPPSHLR